MFGGISLVLWHCICATAVSTFIPVEHPWEYSYQDVQQLADGSYMVSMGMVMEDMNLARISPEGELVEMLDHFSVPGRGLESGGWILPCDDGSFYAVMYSQPWATGIDSDIAVFNLTEEGTVDWIVQIGENSDQVFTCFDASLTEDNGIAVLGGTGYCGEAAFIRTYSPWGELNWEYHFPEGEGFLPMQIGLVEQGLLVLLSHNWEEKTFIQKFSFQGELERSLNLPVKSSPAAGEITVSTQGNMVYFADGLDNQGGYLLSVDDAGDLLIQAPVSHGMVVRDLLIEEDGTLVLAGFDAVDGENAPVLKAFDIHGRQLGELSPGGDHGMEITAICSSFEGGYALFGYTLDEEDASGERGGVFTRIIPQGDSLWCEGESE